MTPRRAAVVLVIFQVLLIHLLTTNQVRAQTEKADGAYFVQSLRKIELTGNGESPFSGNDSGTNWRFWSNAMWATVVLDKPGDAHLQIGNVRSVFNSRLVRPAANSSTDSDNYKIAIRLDQPADVTGTLYFPNTWDGPLMAYPFSIRADQFTAEENDYLEVKLSQYQRLWNSQLTGGAWFRFQANAISKQLGRAGRLPDEETRRNNTWQTQAEMTRTLSLASGGMALSENLQLDRMLTIGTGEDKETFPVTEIEGITVNDFDWEPLVKDIDPKLDTLASYIPADQHAMFVPSFQSLVTLIETGFETVGPLFPLMSQSSASANTRIRYQKQLGLPLGEIQKTLGPKLIKSIAITGGDPYFRTGTDVAVLFEARQPAALESAIQATITLSLGNAPSVEKLAGTSAGVSYSSFVSPDRRVSSYVATLDNVVIVTNSLVQLNRIINVGKQPETSLVKLDEYRFFRDRHMLGDEQETALIVVTDQTIRRWCGPVWRIATSRRTRAAAILSNLHARYMQPLVDGMQTPVNVDIGTSVFALNQFTVADHAAISPTYGTLEFQTPISELSIETVSGREKSAYENWRRGYQSNWSTAFDPIAIRLNIQNGKLAADLTVMPLIDNSQYQTMADISIGAKLDAKRNSRHPQALTWLALALNTESPMLKQWGNMGSSFARVNFMDWLGDAVSVYVDEDALWTDLEKASAGDFDDRAFFQANVHRLPIAIQFNVRSSFRLTAFLVGLRGVIEQTAPDMTTWETRRHRDTAYVKISPTVSSRRNIPDDVDADIALHYFASGDSLIFSLSELVIHRAIERRLKKESGDQVDANADTNANAKTTNDGLPLLGDNFAVQIKRSLAMGILTAFNNDYQKRMQRQSWSAIPILNQWKQLFPKRDPMAVDQVVWKRELHCPGGGTYRWNDQYQTMESSVFGHPAKPKNGPHVGRLLGDWEAGNFGLTFENQGLRAKFELTGPEAEEENHHR